MTKMIKGGKNIRFKVTNKYLKSVSNRYLVKRLEVLVEKANNPPKTWRKGTYVVKTEGGRKRRIISKKRFSFRQMIRRLDNAVIQVLEIIGERNWDDMSFVPEHLREPIQEAVAIHKEMLEDRKTILVRT